MNNLWAFYSSISHVSFSHFILFFIEFAKSFCVFEMNTNEHSGSVFSIWMGDVYMKIEWFNEAFIPAINSLTFKLRWWNTFAAIKTFFMQHHKKMHFEIKNLSKLVICKAKKYVVCYHFVLFMKLNWDEYFMISENVGISLFTRFFLSCRYVSLTANLHSFYL